MTTSIQTTESGKRPGWKESLEIFVDGTNFFRALRENFPGNIDIPVLARRLAAQPPGYQMKRMYYCTAASRHPGTEAYRRQQKFFAELDKSPGIEIVYGRLAYRGRAENGAEIWEEKETDVNVAVRMLTGAYENRYDVAMLIAGDTDYAPAVRAVRALGKSVIWAHFPSQRHCLELAQECDLHFPLTEKFLRTCAIPYRR